MHQVANGEGHPDALFGKSTPVGGDDVGARLHAPARQGDVGGDHDVARPGPFGNPIVGGVHAGAGGDPVDQRILRNADEPRGDHGDGKLMPRGDTVDLVLHRTGIGIDVDVHRVLRNRRGGIRQVKRI